MKFVLTILLHVSQLSLFFCEIKHTSNQITLMICHNSLYFQFFTFAVCEGGWSPYGSHCYFFSTSKMSWDKAKVIVEISSFIPNVFYMLYKKICSCERNRNYFSNWVELYN